MTNAQEPVRTNKNGALRPRMGQRTRSDPFRIEPGEESGLIQPLIAGKKDPAVRGFLAPVKGRCQLQRIRRSEVITLNQLHCQRAQGGGGLNHGPGLAQVFR